MGCWNKTCGLSNLHITHGKEAYVFVLEQQRLNDSHCYATHLYAPLLLPFVTEYNDYGGGENSSGPGLPFVMAGIKDALLEVEEGDNKYHDIAVKKEAFNEELFFEAVHEGRLYKHNRYAVDEDDHTKIEYVMFRKDIVDHILENRVIEKYTGDGYIKYKFTDIVADILPMLQEITEMVIADGERAQFKILGGLEYMFDWKHPNLAAQWLRGDGFRYSRIVDMKFVLSTLFEDGAPPEEQVLKVKALLTEYLKGVFIDAYMEVTRKSWIPAGHEGSQSQDNDEYRLLINAMTIVMDAEDAY
jgi:hypothetical protein